MGGAGQVTQRCSTFLTGEALPPTRGTRIEKELVESATVIKAGSARLFKDKNCLCLFRSCSAKTNH